MTSEVIEENLPQAPHDVLEDRIDMVHRVRRFSDAGVAQDELVKMVAEIRAFELLNNLTECEIFNHQAY